MFNVQCSMFNEYVVGAEYFPPAVRRYIVLISLSIVVIFSSNEKSVLVY